MSGGSGKDKDKTIIGGSLGGPAPAPLPQAPARPAPQGGGQKTVIGGALGAPGQGFGPPGGHAGPSGGDAWGGGGFGPAGSAGSTGGFAPQPQGYGSQGGFGGPTGGFGGQGGFGPAQSGAGSAWDNGFGQPQQSAQPQVSGAFAPSDSFFPDHRPAETGRYEPPAQKIDLRQALHAKGLGRGGPKNPILAAAANLLILFGRLRTQMVEMEAVPLMEHVTREIETFEQNVMEAGITPHEAQVAKYLLCGTADDIVQNIPGTDRHLWIQYSMVARFFNRRTSGVGFFQEVEKALQAPAQRFQLLELALVCLSLGFEGQYRTAPNGAMELQRIRGMIHDSLRRVEPRPDEDISPRWQPVLAGGRRRFGGTPLWVMASVLGVLLLGAYMALSMVISNEGSQVVTRLMSVHPAQAVTLQRPQPVQTPVEAPPPPETEQLDRIRQSLAEDIEAGTLEVDRKGDFIFVRINNTALFDSGKSDVKEAFAALAQKIGGALDPEAGPIKVVGFTDNVPLKGTGRFKNNIDLSVARAESVQKALAVFLADASRLIVEGKGEADPVADNATPEGRALNRRVEIMIAREETLQ